MKNILAQLNKLFISFIVHIPIWLGTIQSVVIHTFVFSGFYAAAILAGGTDGDHIISIFTNILSIEAIYLSIFIQLSVNRSNKNVEQIKEDVSELNENIDDIAEDVSELNENIDDIAEDVSEINENIDDIAEDVDELNDDEHNENTDITQDQAKSDRNKIKNNQSTHEKLKKVQDRMERLQKEMSEILKEL